MIRRDASNGWHLIRQDDHARLSGTLAAALGGAFRPLTADAIEGIALHDGGWSLHDDLPTLNESLEPTDVFKTPRQIDHAVWAASSERATTINPYAGLLVSIHSLRLSAGVFGSTTIPLPDLPPRERFELNRFQHGQIELQEMLRRSLNLATDISLRLGIAEGTTDPREHQLDYDYTWLSALDLLSLAICCTKPPGDTIRPILTYPAGVHGQLHLQRPSEDVLLLHPWPFEPPRIDLEIPYRPVARRSFVDEAAFRAVYAGAKVETLKVTVKPRAK